MNRTWLALSMALGLGMMVQTAKAQDALPASGLPPLFATTPRQIVKAQIIAEFPVNTFLENLVVDGTGNLFVTSLEDGKILRITSSGEVSTFAQIPGKPAGIIFDGRNNLLVTGWAGGTIPTVFRISPAGKVETLATITGAVFLNGITRLSGDRFIIADSYRGAIWEINARTKKYSLWLDDPNLTRPATDNPTPGVNGLKVYKGALYATNTQRQQLLRIPLLASEKPGKLEILQTKINGDDFAFDKRGNLYLTTHIYNNVVRITPEGTVSILADLNEGMSGSTALAFGRGKNDRKSVYVITNGGMSLPPPDGIQKAKVVRLEVGDEGETP